jgi:hypothetical protein
MKGAAAASAETGGGADTGEKLSAVFYACAASQDAIVYVNGKPLRWDSAALAKGGATGSGSAGGNDDGDGDGDGDGGDSKNGAKKQTNNNKKKKKRKSKKRSSIGAVPLCHNDRISLGHCAYVLLVVDPAVEKKIKQQQLIEKQLQPGNDKQKKKNGNTGVGKMMQRKEVYTPVARGVMLYFFSTRC